MAFSPGRNIGRVSIRVVPDTKSFNKDARRQLNDAARTVRARIKVDGADFDKEAVKKDLERQLNEVDGLRINAFVKATVDSAKVNKTLVRKSIQSQFDEMAVRVGIEAHVRNVDEFKHQVHKMVKDASDDKVEIPVVPHTTAARAELQWASRSRVVNFFVKVNEGSLKAAATSLAALSGARIAGNWLEDIRDMAKDLDKNIPKIVGWTTSITSLVAGLTSLAGGLVSVGEGLFSISPMLLAVPGLAINAVGSLIALIVAWKDAGNQLSPLADGMNELGEIINTTYWNRARQPILDLVNGLMPQLRNAFFELSDGVGEFTGALAQAFGEELSGGRLESIFGGIAEGWRVLGTGASGFAGAIVNLSQIAATYTPRLAAWFVRQANTFDAWLTAISTDGRLGDWMEDAIKNMYALWDATTGIAGVFAGIFRAAEAAGSEGLIGFADLMQRWERVVNSADFQKGLTAVFRGSYAAMEAFGDAIKGIGRLIADLSGPIERFIGGAGNFLGGLVEAIADALNTPVFAKGLDDFTNGLTQALEGIKPSLQPIADTFGGFVGLLGDLAGNLLPAAAQVISDLTPAFDGIIRAVEPVLPQLATTLTSLSDTLAPAISDFVDAAGPAFQTIVTELATAIKDLAPAAAEITKGLASAVRGLNGWSEQNKGFFDKLVLDWTPDEDKWKVRIEQSAGIGPMRGSSGWVLPKFDANDKVSVDEYAKSIVRVYKDQLATGGPAAGEAFLEGLKSVDMPTPILDQLKSRFGPDLDQELNSRGRAGGGSLTRGLAAGMDESTAPGASVGRLRASLGTFTMDSNKWLTPAGAAAMDGFKAGSENQQPGIAGWFASLGTPFGDAMAGAASWLLGRGGDTMGGFKSGAEGGTEATKGVFSGLNGGLTGATSGSNLWLNGRGSDAMRGFGSGAEGSRGGAVGVFGGLVGLVTSAIPNPLGLLWSAGSSIMSGFLSGLKSTYENVKTFIGGIGAWIAANKGPEAYDRQLLVPAGGWIMDGFQRGLERGFGRVQSRVAGMASAIREQFSAGLSGDVAAGIDLSANAARSIAASAKAKAEQDASALSAQGAGSKTYVLQGLTTRETAEEIAEEIDKKERRSIVRTGALPTTEVT